MTEEIKFNITVTTIVKPVNNTMKKKSITSIKINRKHYNIKPEINNYYFNIQITNNALNAIFGTKKLNQLKQNKR